MKNLFKKLFPDKKEEPKETERNLKFQNPNTFQIVENYDDKITYDKEELEFLKGDKSIKL